MSAIPAVRQQVSTAVRACEDKKAQDLAILQLDKRGGFFTDFFVICSGANPRQVQAIAEDVELKLKQMGVTPTHTEGYRQAEWVLLDYVDFVVHIFSEAARRFYDLERLWKSAKKLTSAELAKPARERSAPKAKREPAKRRSSRAAAAKRRARKR